MLAGQPPVPVPTDRDWSAWQLHARFQRVVPLLYELVDRVPTALSDHVRLEVRQLQADSMAWAVRVEHELLEVTARLRACGLGSVVLKGVATAHLDYPTPAWRQFGDADLLVLPDEFPNACRVISDSGWEQGYELPRHHERFTHAITFVRNGVELDLHQRIGHRAIGLLVPTAQLVRVARPFELAGTELMALSDHDRLIHAAVHAATSRGTTKRLSSTADVWTRGPDLLVLDQGGTLEQQRVYEVDPDNELIAIPGLGDAEVRLGLAGNEIRILRPAGRFVRVVGTLPPDDLLAFARSLVEGVGNELVVDEGAALLE